jgi:hypothetical protein
MRTSEEIRTAARDMRDAVGIGKALEPNALPSLTHLNGIAKVAEALEWAAGVEKDFGETLRIMRSL